MYTERNEIFMKKLLSAIIAASLAATMIVPVYADKNTDDDEEKVTATSSPSPSPTAETGSTPSTAKPSTSKTKFSDIEDKNYKWAYDSIMNMADKGYVSGYEDGTYRPDNSVTRLEVLALFSRVMGSRDEENEAIIELAHEMYDETIATYGLSWGTDEIVYLMYRGVLKKSDLNTYLKGTLKDEPMPRYEAAIIITKAMGGENEATSTVGISLDYADVNTIPKTALQYVNYVTEEGIMTGMDDNKFSPTTSVLRSQMAVMLERTDKKADYSFEKATLVSIDEDEKKITLSDEDGYENTLPYTDSTSFRVKGELVQTKDMVTDISVILTYSGSYVAYVDAMSDVPNETVSGVYMSNSASNGVIKTITIKPDGSKNERKIECSEDLEILFEGSPAKITAFTRESDFVTVKIENGKAVSVIGEQKSSTISNATIEEISVEPDFTMTISHASDEYDGKTYPISDDVVVFKNDETANFNEIFRGDTVNLTLEYGKITKVRATSKTRIIEGTITALTVAAKSSMTVKVNGTETVYDIPNGVTITINGNSGTLYDFRVGDTVKITTESQAITKIVATHNEASSGTISGSITAINSAFGFIKVAVKGSDYEETVYCTEKTTILDSTGKTKTLKQLEEGQEVVTATGTMTNGAFSADLVVVK